MERLAIDLVDHFPYEYMHLICLGVMKKLFTLWLTGSLNVRLRAASIEKISSIFKEMRTCVPWEFQRKPRSLKEFKRFKATELREILCYYGPVAFKADLKKHVYEHFLTLHVAVRILASPNYCIEQNEYAHSLLLYFVKNFPLIYGSKCVSYNVHGLVHVARDVLHFGPLDSYSAFQFENFLQIIKKMLRKSEKPLQQICNRVSEIGNPFL